MRFSTLLALNVLKFRHISIPFIFTRFEVKSYSTTETVTHVPIQELMFRSLCYHICPYSTRNVWIISEKIPLLNFTFMLPCIVILVDLFLMTNQTHFFFFFNRHCNPCGVWPAQLSSSILSRKVFTECRCQRHVKPQLGGPVIRTFQLPPPGVPHIWNDSSEP